MKNLRRNFALFILLVLIQSISAPLIFAEDVPPEIIIDDEDFDSGDAPTAPPDIIIDGDAFDTGDDDDTPPSLEIGDGDFDTSGDDDDASDNDDDNDDGSSNDTSGSGSNGGGSAAKECNDGRDNDHDGKTDYPSDPGCKTRTDDNEDDPDGDIIIESTHVFPIGFNPYSQSIKFFFTLSEDADVTLKIITEDGITVDFSNLGEMEGGTEHFASWDGRGANGNIAARGKYYYKIGAENPDTGDLEDSETGVFSIMYPSGTVAAGGTDQNLEVPDDENLAIVSTGAGGILLLIIVPILAFFFKRRLIRN